MPTERRVMEARFVWSDGWVDLRESRGHPRQYRFRWDREDISIDNRYVLLQHHLSTLTPDSPVSDIVEFERIDYEDGSFEYREINRDV